MADIYSPLPYNFFSKKPLEVKFSGLDLSSDAGLFDDVYYAAGTWPEPRIKELKLGIKADRLSCQKFIVNQFRLFLSQAAYILMLTIRKAAEGTRLAQAQVTRGAVNFD